MLSKIASFQGALYKVFFSYSTAQYFKQQDVAVKTHEKIIQTICITTVYFSGINLYDGLFMPILIAGYLQIYLFPLLTRSSFIFQLPLKRSFIIKNIYLFSWFNVIAISLAFLNLIFFPPMISDFINNKNHFLDSFKYDIGMYQTYLMIIAFSLIWICGMATICFIQKTGARITLYIMLTIFLGGFNVFTTAFLTKYTNDKYFDLTRVLVKTQHSWMYTAIAVGTALIVSVSGMLISLRRDKPHFKLKTLPD